MRIPLLAAAISFVICGAVHAESSFITLDTPNLYLTKISGNGEYAVGSIPYTSGARWFASTGQVELLPELIEALGINNVGTISGAVPENGGSYEGGRDLGAIAKVGMAPELLSNPLDTNSAGYDISEEGTVVGLSFGDNFGVADAFVWTAAEGMTALPIPRPQEYSRANVISADGRVIAGWNDGEYGRSNIIWIDRVPMAVAEPDGWEVGEATGVSKNGTFVVGGDHVSEDGDFGSWRWSDAAGLTFIPGMGYAFGVSDDGKTVIGSADFFDPIPRAAKIWREGMGTISLAEYLVEQGIALPAGWDPDLAGGFGGMSADGTTMSGFAYGPLNEIQSYIIRLDGGSDDVIFADGFDAVPN